MALVRHKWNSFGRYVYYFTLALYFTFVIFLTDFIINTPAPYSPKQILEYSTYGNRYGVTRHLLYFRNIYGVTPHST